MATIRLRGKRWQVIVKRKGVPLQSKTFDIKKDAEKWGRQQERLIDTGLWSNTESATKTTLNQLLDRYLAEVTPAKRGKVAETCRINGLKKSFLSKYSVAAISGNMIASWRDARLKCVSGSTVAKEMGLLSHIFSIAVKEWGFVLHSNPVSSVRKPPQPAARERVLNDAERRALLDSCGSCRNPWIKPITKFALETASRRGEILTLTWNDIDLTRRTAKLNGKSGIRTIPLSIDCISMLNDLPRSIDDRVFPVTVETLKQAYQRAVQRAGITNFTFHDLRHDALTQLAKRGLSVLELRAISGHTTANMLQRYVSIDPSELALKLTSRS
jgi:integrase